MAKEIDWGQYFHPDASTTLWQQMGLVLRLRDCLVSIQLPRNAI